MLNKKKIRVHQAGAELNNPDLIKQMPRVQSSILKPLSVDLDIVIWGVTRRNLSLAASASGDTACVEDLALLSKHPQRFPISWWIPRNAGPSLTF